MSTLDKIDLPHLPFIAQAKDSENQPTKSLLESFAAMEPAEQVNFGRKIIAFAMTLEEMQKAVPALRQGMVTPLSEVCRGFLGDGA